MTELQIAELLLLLLFIGFVSGVLIGRQGK